MSLKIKKLEVWEIKIPFRFTFKHALAERSQAHNLILAAHADSGHIGYGEILPRSYLTGETIETAWQDIEDRLWPAIADLQFGEELPLAALAPVYREADRLRRTGSYAGIDVAVVDAWARAMRRPGNSIFGQRSERQSFTCPVGGGGIRATTWITRFGKWSGYRDFKVKTGRSDDEARLARVREIIGDSRDMRVDANAAFSVDQALQQSSYLRRLNISSVEQPIPAGDVASLARVQREGGIPVMADESLCTLADAQALIDAKAAQIWNIRLAKVGGYSGFIEMIKLAEKNGIALHQGVLVGETPILTAAARSCSGLAKYKHVEFGFPKILLKRNLFSGAPKGNFGSGNPLSDRPGLGIEPDRKVLGDTMVRYKIYER